MDNATPFIPDIQATFDYWATVESDDLTQIAGEESAVLTEQAFPPVDPNATLAAAGLGVTPTTAATAVAYQLPNTGSGGIDGGAVGFALLIGVLFVLAMSLVVRRLLA